MKTASNRMKLVNYRFTAVLSSCSVIISFRLAHTSHLANYEDDFQVQQNDT
jgi:hypothetical protein